MNIRMPTDYTTMFAALDALMAAQLPQMDCTARSVGWSAAELKKARLLQRPSTCK